MSPPIRALFLATVAVGAASLPVACSRDDEDAGQPAARAEPVESEFIRFVETGEHEGRLETAVSTYRDARGVEVDLIAVVHVADRGYYEALDRRLRSYDAVLYEMVAPEGVDVAQLVKSDSLVSTLQRGLCRALGLAFQLDSIDYAAANLVRADLTTGEFAALWQERGELWKMFLRVLSTQFGSETRAPQLTPAALFEAVRSKNRAQRMKFLLGREFAGLDAWLSGAGQADESVLIGERNKAALRVLEVSVGKGARKVAIFYGAGHMSDIELRLQSERLFWRTAHEWLVAWRIAG